MPGHPAVSAGGFHHLVSSSPAPAAASAAAYAEGIERESQNQQDEDEESNRKPVVQIRLCFRWKYLIKPSQDLAPKVLHSQPQFSQLLRHKVEKVLCSHLCALSLSLFFCVCPLCSSNKWIQGVRGLIVVDGKTLEMTKQEYVIKLLHHHLSQGK